MQNPTQSNGTKTRRSESRMRKPDAKRIVLDGPFTESKELFLGGGSARSDVGRYASVNGLRMYHEVHGRGRPVVLLHGGLSNIVTGWGKVVRALAQTRKVIALEQQAHGRTADIQRVLSYEQMADDTAELLRKLEIHDADFYGFSMGAATSLMIAARHPDVVHKLVVVSGGAHPDGFDRAWMAELFRKRPDALDWPPQTKDAFLAGAASPDMWPAAIERIHQAFVSFRGLRREQVRAIRAPALIVGGEYGIVRYEHTRELARLVPRSRLEIFAGDDHDPKMVERSAALVPGFLDA